jgi:hypothetical protein
MGMLSSGTAFNDSSSYNTTITNVGSTFTTSGPGLVGGIGGGIVLESISANGTTYDWQFDTTGNLNIPGNIVGPASANLIIYANAGVHEFTFGDDGTFYAPDNVVLGGSTISIGPDANSLTGFGNAVLVASSNSEAYVQAVINNVSDVGSADWVAYGHHGTDAGGWADIGFTSSGYNDPDFTITKPGSGYVFAHGFDINTQPVVAGDGSLVLATGEQGNVKDIIFATGGFLEANEFMRISDSNNALQFYDGGNITGANVISANTFISNGNLHLQPDSANVNAYLDIFLTGGAGPDIHIAGNGENVIIGRDTGANVAVNVDGKVSIKSDAGTPYTWTFEYDGNLTLPGNTFSVNYANGTQVPLGATGATGPDGATGPVGPQGVSVTLIGSVADSASLPVSGNAGDGYITIDSGDLWIWNTVTTSWNDVGQIVGPQGATGLGATGATGIAGVNGATGATGLRGSTGANGTNGATGATGIAGVNGATGATGIAGVNGATGATGTAGVNGATGATGLTGTTGATGPQGSTGATGPVAGSNTQVIFNDANAAGANANFTFNKSTSVLTVTGNIIANNINAGNLLTANYSSAVLTTGAQPNITSTGTLSSLTVSGNINAGNVIINGQLTTYGTVTPAYMVVGLVNSISGFSNGSTFILDTIVGNINSQVSYNSSNGVFTLTAGVTYDMSFTPSFITFSNTTTGFFCYDWVDATTNALLDTTGIGTGTSISSQDTTAQQDNATARVIYTPSTNQTVKLRVSNANGTVTLRGGIGTQAVIKPLNPTIAVQATTAMGFRATTPVTDVSVNNGASATMLFGTEEVDTNSCYNPATGRFTPNVAGYYSIDWFIVTSANGANELLVTLNKNGTDIAWGTNVVNATSHWNGVGGSAGMVYLNGTTDYIFVKLTNNSGSTATVYSGSLSYFSAYLIR